MRTLDYDLPAEQGGGKLINFQYSRSLNELIGTWSAEIAGAFTGKAGDSITFAGAMGNGVISKVRRNADGLYLVEGYDAGVRLMRSTPHSKDLAEGSAKAVIEDLANSCGMAVTMQTGGLSGFNVRSAVTGSTCAEAILELCQLSGCVAYVDNGGRLQICPPDASVPSFAGTVILDDTGSELDLDGYATQVTCVVTRRKKTLKEEKEHGGPHTHYMGKTPNRHTTTENKSSSFSYVDKEGVTVKGSYKVTILQPFGVVQSSTRTIERNNVKITVEEEHDYIHDNQLLWRGDTEYLLWAWCEQSYTCKKTVEGTYPSAVSGHTSFKEVTVETMNRSFSPFDALWVPRDWKGKCDMVAKEEYARNITRSGGGVPKENMPTYSPPNDCDSRITREFQRVNFGKGLLCFETEINYEPRQVGGIESVHYNGEKYLNYDGKLVAIQAHAQPMWVKTNTYRTYYEKYAADGTCEFSSKSEYCDDGAEWMLQNGITATGRVDEDKFQEDYAKFSQRVSGIDIELGSASISSTQWQFLEQTGRKKIIGDSDSDKYAVNSAEWYYNGNYIPSRICPHYDGASKKCEVYGIAAIGDFDGDDCPYRGRGWRSCVRAEAALEQARSEDDRPLLEKPVVGVATAAGGANVGYRREFYIDDIVTEDAAKAIAQTAAANILSVKGIKGYRRTITIPYSSVFTPNGAITAVSYDWGAMTTQISYREGGYIPQFLIPDSVGGVASFVSERDSSRRTKSISGTVLEVKQDGLVVVDVGGMTYECSTKLVNIGQNDSVLISFASGNNIRGQIIERL